MIENRLCKLSKNKESFDSVKGAYQNALENSSFTHKPEYKEAPNTRNKRNVKCIYYKCSCTGTYIFTVFVTVHVKYQEK